MPNLPDAINSVKNNFSQFCQEKNFKITNLITDGDIHRFDRDGKRNAWYVAREYRNGGTESYLVVSFGDWKTGEVHTFKPSGNLSREKLAEFHKLEQANREREAKQKTDKAVFAEASAREQWELASGKKSEYLERKGFFGKLYGARVDSNGFLLVPTMRGSRMLGLQRIAPDGEKRFVAGQRFKGCSFVIGAQSSKDIKKFILCEGFATGATLHEALAMPILVTFSAQNLVEVAKELVGKPAVICADNDQWTDGNPGVTAGAKAAAILGCKLIVPHFEDRLTNPTDFNDLHMLNGIDEVKRQLGAVMEEPSKILKKIVASEQNTLTNFDEDIDGDGEIVKTPITDIASIWQKLDAACEGRLKRLGKMPFFVQPSGEIRMFEQANDLFGFFFSRGMVVKWSERLTGAITKTEFYRYIGTVAEAFDQITAVPHYPKIPGVFYSREIAPQKTGALDELIGMFNYATENDRQMIKAAYVTPFWGGPGGGRPAFLYNGLPNDPMGNRGIGKTINTDALSNLCGDCIDISNKTDGEDIRKRLLTGGDTRLIRMDNVKSNTLSNDVIESIITTRKISGHRLYKGHHSVPNWFTLMLTFNDAMLSKDFAQRCMVIRLKRPTYHSGWSEKLYEFIDKNRERIIADIGFLLEQKSDITETRTRFPAWERDVLSKCCTDLDKVLDNVEAEQKAVDADTTLKEELSEIFHSKLAAFRRPGLKGLVNFNPDTDNIAIKRSTVLKWVGQHIDPFANRKYLMRKLEHAKPDFLLPETKKYLGDFYLIWSPSEAKRRRDFLGHESNFGAPLFTEPLKFSCWRINPTDEKLDIEPWDTTVGYDSDAPK